MAKPEDVLDQVLSGELTLEEAVARHPDVEDRLLLLTDLVDELQALPSQAPAPEFRHRARLKLLQRIQETRPRRRWWDALPPLAAPRLPGWANAISASLIAFGGLTFGTTYASASALPDDALYPMKRALEQVNVAMAKTDEAKANTYLGLADRRAAEIAAVATDIDDFKLQGLTEDYGDALLRVTLAVQTLQAPPQALLDKVQSHVASQATEIEARALNSTSRPAVQQRLVQAEVVASNAVDHVTLIAERSGKPGPQDVRLAANPPAAATAGAAASAPGPIATPAAATTRVPAPSTATTSNHAGSTTLDGQFDQLWNQVAAAPFMGQHVRTQLEADVANAKQDTHTGRSDAAVADMNAFITQLQAAVNSHQATQYTANRLIAEAKAILAAL
jgi:hypothetical protein